MENPPNFSSMGSSDGGPTSTNQGVTYSSSSSSFNAASHFHFPPFLFRHHHLLLLSPLFSLLLLSSLFNGCPTPTHSITTILGGAVFYSSGSLSLFSVGENTHKAKIKGFFLFFLFFMARIQNRVQAVIRIFVFVFLLGFSVLTTIFTFHCGFISGFAKICLEFCRICFGYFLGVEFCQVLKLFIR